MGTTEDFLEMLARGATREQLDAVLATALDDVATRGGGPAEAAELRRRHELALGVAEQAERARAREAELSALYETAQDLTRIRDVDAILAAIVRRARLLLRADMTYLSLNDEAEGASYMKVTDGALTAEFRTLRLPLGTGLLGLVAQTGAPYYTEDYQSDARFLHADFIDEAVAGERIRAILGVPLVLDGAVIGALLAVHRTVRPFPPGEVTLLTSFAAHAVLALENARLFDANARALEELDAAHRQVRAHSEAVERAAVAHDRLTDAMLAGGGVSDVVRVLAEVLGGTVRAVDPDGVRLAEAGAGPRPDAAVAAQVEAALPDAAAEARRTGRSVEVPGVRHGYVATASAGGDGGDHLGTLVLTTSSELAQAERRTLERGAIVVTLVLLFARSAADAEEQVRGELLSDLVRGSGEPARLRERARRQGADLERACVVAVAVVDRVERHRTARIGARFADERSGLAGVVGPHLVVATGDGDDPVEVGRALQGRVGLSGGRATVGVALAARGVADLPGAYAEALRCAETLVTLGRVGEVADPAGLGLARLLLGGNGAEELGDFVETMVGPVLAYDRRRGTRLAETLEVWLTEQMSLKETAVRLHVHPNTVAQRIERVGALLGDGWRDPRRRLDLELALRLWRLREES